MPSAIGALSALVTRSWCAVLHAQAVRPAEQREQRDRDRASLMAPKIAT
jgi:hypothetical protein